jgi:tRNA threonylcarbamoyladenosine biosynthesis protein TsaB
VTWLAVDTATAHASVALGAPGQGAVEESLEGSRQHARQLIPMVERLLSRSGLTLDDLEGVLLADGPGSFTGLRVSAAFAKALVNVRGLALRTAPSLRVRAASEAADGAIVMAVADALRGDVYLAAYRFSPDALTAIIQPSVVPADETFRLAELADRVVGDLPDGLEQALGDKYRGHAAPSAAVLIDLLSREGGTDAVVDVQSWEPVYGRPAEAQAKWEREHGRALPREAGASG